MTAGDVLSRGVYYEPWFGPNGERYLVAVTRDGRRIMEATIFPGVEASTVEDLLWDILNREDPPPPRLSIVA
jgi:hypothetical protein